jgi:hypothetical protein
VVQIHPGNGYLSLWTLYVLVCLAWVALLLPVDLCYDLSSAKVYSACEVIVDVSFWIDLLSNCKLCSLPCVALFLALRCVRQLDRDHDLVAVFIGYRRFDPLKESYKLEFNRLKVASHYFRGWFCIDFIACLSSLDTVMMNAGEAVKLARMPRLLRLLRMVRLLRLLKLAKIKSEMRDIRSLSFLGDLSSLMSSGLAQVAKVFILLIMVAHWAGSIWYLIAAFNWRFGDEREIDCLEQTSSWVKSAELCDVKSDTELYLYSVYWAFSTLTTVGPCNIVFQWNSFADVIRIRLW